MPMAELTKKYDSLNTMEFPLCTVCGLTKGAKGSATYICSVCSKLYHRLCMQDKCPCSDTSVLLEYPTTVCMFPLCKSPIANELFCTACTESVCFRIYKLVDLYGTDGLKESIFNQKLLMLPGLPSWMLNLIDGSFFHCTYTAWSSKHQKTILCDKAVYYTIEHFILRSMLFSNYTMFSNTRIKALSAFIHIQQHTSLTEDALLKMFRIFLRKITTKPKAPVLWLPNGLIRKSTPLNIFDKQSLLQQTVQRSTQGIPIENIYAEYPEAHQHLCELRDEGSIWICGNWEVVFPFTVALKSIEGLREAWLAHNT